jgi:hypothetical protein
MTIKNDCNEARIVRAIGGMFGYGRVMQLAEELWREKLKIHNMEGGEHTVGPCATFMVPCPHPENNNQTAGCDWCCGSGRVTERVREAMNYIIGR